MRAGYVENQGSDEVQQSLLGSVAETPDRLHFGVHRRSSFAGMVFRSMNCATALAGTRTARPQFTRGSFLFASHARIVETFTFKAFAVSSTVSRFFMLPL
jgi:hypothetical protein